MKQKRPKLEKRQTTTKSRKKIGLFYKINFSILLTLSLLLLYFVVLVSTKPKSIPYVTKTIETKVKERFGDDSTIEQTYLSFTKYGTLKIAISNLNIPQNLNETEEKQAFIFPKVETEFSLINLLFLNFNPRVIKIIDSEITIDRSEKPLIGSELVVPEVKNDESKTLSNLLVAIKEKGFLVKQFEIRNAKLTIKNPKITTNILIKKSKIRTSIRKGISYISLVNKVNFNQQASDVDLNLNCQLQKESELGCEGFLENFVPNSIANLHPILSNLNNIEATLSLSLSFSLKDSGFEDISFKAEAAKGSFNFLNFFHQKIDFSNFALKGSYDHKGGILNLSEIKTDFLIDEEKHIFKENDDRNSHLMMSFAISNLNNEEDKKMDFDISLKNVANNELEKFWPSALAHSGIRSWVLSHIKNGLIKDAHAKFSITHNDQKSELNDMNAQVSFAGFYLKYDESFPAISNLSGDANFSHNSMKINISNGEVLNSKISDSLVSIDNFSAPKILLNIVGSSRGDASDSMKHIDNTSDFSNMIEKYLNGNSQNNFEIIIPLASNNMLKDSYISVNSAIANLSNDYIRGGVIVSSKKNFGSKNFITNIDLTTGNLDIKALDIKKESGIEGGLELVVAIPNAKTIQLNNIALWKKEETQNKGITKISRAKISGNVEFEIAPFLLTSISLKNDNFGKNNYDFSYKTDKKSSTQKLVIKGRNLNLGPLIEQKAFFKPKGGGFKNSQFQIALDNIYFLRGKKIKSFYLATNSRNDFLDNISVKGFYGNKKSIFLQSVKQENLNLINGKIDDVGYVAEMLGILNTISSGNAEVKIRVKVANNKQIYDGQIEVNDGITIFENNTVKRLSKNDLFSKIKDSIFSENKTTFDSVRLEFEMKDNLLNINSLIANNYKIGITAKGFVNLKDDSFEIKGMIVPGFIVNNLFGIGNIPILGSVINGLLTGGQGGGLFGIRYEYIKKPGDKEASFETNKVSAFVPTTIRNLFDAI